MENSTIIIIGIFVSVIIMFVFPTMIMADKNDEVAKVTVQKATTDFVNTVRNTGKIKQEDYDNYILKLTSTGNAYNAEIQVQILDKNPSIKSTHAKSTIGDNVYYTEYTTQIIDKLKGEGSYIELKEGDIISVSVENANLTIAAQFRKFLYEATGNIEKTITASETGVVTTDSI